jgi:hypothetical protein
MLAMGQALSSPRNGDIEFVCPGETENETQSMFAHGTVLSARSEYFATSTFEIEVTDLLVLGSSFAEAISSKINTEDNYDILHNILYYIYTDRIIFGTRDGVCPSKNLPKICSAEDIYETADRMMLDKLRLKAFEFLGVTCDKHNITSRVMSKFADVHPKVAKLYDDYFQKHWESIKGTEEFKQAFTEVEGDFEEFQRRHEKFMNLMMKATFK